MNHAHQNSLDASPDLLEAMESYVRFLRFSHFHIVLKRKAVYHHRPDNLDLPRLYFVAAMVHTSLQWKLPARQLTFLKQSHPTLLQKLSLIHI